MFVHQTNLFKEMSMLFIEELNKITVTVNYNKGNFIFRVGEPAHNFYILLQGRVRMIIGENRHTITIANNTGEAFGWSCLVGFDSYTASAECLVPCTLAKIEKENCSDCWEKTRQAGCFSSGGLRQQSGKDW